MSLCSFSSALVEGLVRAHTRPRPPCPLLANFSLPTGQCPFSKTIVKDAVKGNQGDKGTPAPHALGPHTEKALILANFYTFGNFCNL